MKRGFVVNGNVVLCVLLIGFFWTMNTMVKSTR